MCWQQVWDCNVVSIDDQIFAFNSETFVAVSTHKTRILDVVYNDSDNNLVHTKTLVKVRSSMCFVCVCLNSSCCGAQHNLACFLLTQNAIVLLGRCHAIQTVLHQTLRS